jgi:hypothetical protein
LAEVAALAQVTHGACYLQAVILGHSFFRFAGELWYQPFRLFYFKRLVAASAEGVCGAKLHQGAAFTPQYLTRLDGC